MSDETSVDQNEPTNDNSGIEDQVDDIGLLSDEEVLAMPLDHELEDQAQSSVEVEDVGYESEETGGAVSDGSVEDDDEGEDSALAEEYENDGTDEGTEATDQDPYSDDQSVQSDVEQVEVSPESTDEIDYKAEYERVLSPFKASGKTVEPKSIEEVVRLAQMGYDYGRKVAALKPQQRLIQTLEKNDITLEDVNYLVDLRQGKPEAIKKLLAEKSIDPMDLDLQEGVDYEPTDHSVSDSEAVLNEVVQEISQDESFKDTQVRLQKLDKASKSTLETHPADLRVLHEHIATGLYDKVMSEVEHQRALGHLAGVPDLIAYERVGNAMFAQEPSTPPKQSPSPTETSKLSAQDSGSPEPEAKAKGKSLRNRKRAASPQRGAAKPGKRNPKDIGRLSDEDFLKEFDSL
jgi:hypothetical protein